MRALKMLDRRDVDGAARWDQFVLGCPNASFFHRAGWQRIVAEVFRHKTFFLYVDNDGVIEGVLPLAQVKSLLFGHGLVSLPFAVYGGVAAICDEAADLLEAEAQSLAQRLGVEHLELRNVASRHADWPAQDLYVTFRKAILPDEEANMLAIPRKQRAMVRKGIANGLVAEEDIGVDRFFALYADNVHRHGTPALPKRYFQALRQEFGDDCDVLTIVSRDGTPLSSPRRGAALLRRRRRVGPPPRRQRLQVLGADAAVVPARPQGVRLRTQQAGHGFLLLQEELGLRADAAPLRIPALQTR